MDSTKFYFHIIIISLTILTEVKQILHAVNDALRYVSVYNNVTDCAGGVRVKLSI